MAESVSVYKKSGTLQVTLNGAQPPWDPWNVPSVVFVMEAAPQASRARDAKSGKTGAAAAAPRVYLKFHDLDNEQAKGLQDALTAAVQDLRKGKRDFNIDVTSVL